MATQCFGLWASSGVKYSSEPNIIVLYTVTMSHNNYLARWFKFIGLGTKVEAQARNKQEAKADSTPVLVTPTKYMRSVLLRSN